LDFLIKNKKIRRERVKLNLSHEMVKFLNQCNMNISDLLLEYNEIGDICYVDISDKIGYLKIMPTSKYINMLNKYKNDNNMNDEWFDRIKNHFLDFQQLSSVNKSIQHMKSGRFIRNILNIKPYDVETFTIRYKLYQINLYR